MNLRHLFKYTFFILLTPLLINFSYGKCILSQNKTTAMLQRAGAMVSEKKQEDFGRIYQSSSCYLESWPKTIPEVVNLVSIAYANNIPIRTQGEAHSQNGHSLAKNFELQIHTTNLNQIHFDRIGQVRVGPGVPVALLAQIVSQKTGYFLPIFNSGGIAPSVGGFISAGGISHQSKQYGGFWEHVNSVKLIAENGKIVQITRSDPLFNYLFGSMGQLGIIVEVELNLLRDPRKPYIYPLHKSISVQYVGTNGDVWPSSAVKPIYWFNLFIPPHRVEEAVKDLAKLRSEHQDALNYFPMYFWEMSYITKMPPLIYDKNEGFYVIGIWGNPLPSLQSKRALIELKNGFDDLVFQKKYRRYIQAELSKSPDLYAKYFSSQTLSEFRRYKNKLDPKFLFNKYSFFKN